MKDMNKNKKSPSLFTQELRKLAREIPSGRVATYGMLARAAGGTGQSARSVSGILARDPQSDEIPFRCIVYACGRVWTSACVDQRRNILYKKEGIQVNKKGKIENFHQILHTFGEHV